MNFENVNFKQVLIGGNSEWEKEAQDLAISRTAFVLVGCDYTSDIQYYTKLGKIHGMETRFDPKLERAYFWPKTSH